MMTMREIAHLCGVSRATVSAVPNGNPGVAERTRNKILSVLREHGNPSRRISQSLMGLFSHVVMVVVRDINNPYFTAFLDGAHGVLRANGLHMLCHSSQESYEEEARALADLPSYQLAGMLIFPVEVHQSRDHIRAVLDARVPLVTVGRIEELDTHRIDVDHHLASRMATEYVLDRGHRRVACLAGPSDSPPTKARVMGFVEAVLDRRIDFHESMVTRAGSSSHAGYDAAVRLLGIGNRPTALVCFNDLVAIGVYRAAHELHLRIPQDISVVGIDDIDIAAVLGPPLTTVSTSPRAMGEAAATMLIDQISGSGSNGDYINRRVEPVLVERESVQTLP